MSHFQIHRLDDPTSADDHYRAFWRIDGRTFRVHVWGLAAWERLTGANRPRDACRLEGSAWMTLRPIEEAAAVHAGCTDHTSEDLSPSPVRGQ
jgi:hypothetical protein